MKAHGTPADGQREYGISPGARTCFAARMAAEIGGLPVAAETAPCSARARAGWRSAVALGVLAASGASASTGVGEQDARELPWSTIERLALEGGVFVGVPGGHGCKSEPEPGFTGSVVILLRSPRLGIRRRGVAGFLRP